MQIFLGIILVIILIGIIIYKLDNKFEKREIIILSSIVIIVILVFTMYQKNQENFSQMLLKRSINKRTI